jgi:hypothetical protein
MLVLVQAALNKRQCFLLIWAGSLSHFFLDHLFEVSMQWFGSFFNCKGCTIIKITRVTGETLSKI